MSRSFSSRPLLSRRAFGRSVALAIAAAGSRFASAAKPVRTTQAETAGFFTLGRSRSRWFFLDRSRRPFFSVGLNHVDSSTLRYPEHLAAWQSRYGGSQSRWLRESVAPNLKRWGFNSVGWTQEVTIKSHAHTPAFTLEEYQALGLPYCHLLPFVETHQWDQWHRNPDVASRDFEDWCDYVARAACGQMRDDPLLIGYFYVDCPTWVHTRPPNEWRGPMFDPQRLSTDAGKRELFDLATRYYRTIHDAVRRYDPHHLLLGDRYEANAPLPMEIVNAAKPYVDVLSFQDFKQPVEHLARWYKDTGKPVLWADGARPKSVRDGSGRYSDGEYFRNDGAWYAEVLAGLRGVEGCVGSHLCGAYLRNRFRKRGLLDEEERPDEENLKRMIQANQDTNDWIRTFD